MKLIILAGIILAGNVFIGFAVYITNQKRIESQQLVKKSEKIISNLGNIHLLGKDIESASRGFIITNDSSFLKPLFTAEKLIFKNIGQLRQQFQNNAIQTQRVDSIHYYMEKRLAFSLHQAELRSNQGLAAAIAFASTNQGLHYSDNLRQIITAIEQHEDTNLKQLQQANMYSVKAFNWISRIMVVLISLITILLLIVTGKNLQQNEKREKKAAELVVANKELAFQNSEKENRAAELIVANKELAFQNKEKENRAAELILANKELVFQNEEKGKRAAELIIADKELVFQNEEKEKQEAANKELEAFSYSVSHDLRAPLRHIGGFVDLLIKNSSNQLDEKGTRYLNIISESSHEMGNLIDALLTFSRLSRTELKKTNINSQNIVNQVLKSFDKELAGRDVEIIVSELPDTTGDETLIHQVWENLISNALKYSKNKQTATIDIGYELLDNKTVFHIRDNGAGFDMKYADKLFGVFQRLHSASDFEGIGIGLANVNRIVVRHGGTCRAESEVGNGATFFFSIPNEEVFSRSDQSQKSLQ
ncbi:MAG: CHASE3 domain-containing protein [Bacteroidota bacterium]|nr:CHASE3 domain-containing protein [Bacteroidota bacterium]